MEKIELKITMREALLLVEAIDKVIDELNYEINNPLEEEWWKQIAKKKIEKYEGMRRVLHGGRSVEEQ